VTGSASPAPSGGVHPVLLRAFAALPRRMRLGLVRVLTPNFTVGALCVLEHDGRILLLRQVHREGWTLPGGLLERGEVPAETVVREVGEETGLRIVPAEPIAHVVDPVEKRVDVIFHVPVGTPVDVRPRGEATRAQWLAPGELGATDRPTAQALDAFAAARSPRGTTGRLIGP
jgi:ADP-ribose pyrophosphatase YjhB (NUDIX family)